MSDVAFAEGPYAMLVYRRILIFYDIIIIVSNHDETNWILPVIYADLQSSGITSMPHLI